MSSLLLQLKELHHQWKQQLETVKTLSELELLRVTFLGKKGTLQSFFKQLGSLSLEEKREVGPQLNHYKNIFEYEIEEKKNALIEEQIKQEQIKKASFDVTSYTPLSPQGHLHPYTPFIQEIEDIFLSMGFELLDGPELETDYHNFTALNIPDDHPARDMYDTFWINHPHTLLRTHTSSVQIRAMKTKPLPLAGISIGRVFRHEATDASHDYMFMQCEGIVIDKHITLADLFGVIQQFIRTLFNTNTLDIRTRPGFFPFVEPGVEIDIRCPFCTSGCSTCKKSKWIEIFPGGIIHPHVLQEANIDPSVYSGFAFGFGLTRMAMLRYGIKDIRLIHSGKIPFLKQFK